MSVFDIPRGAETVFEDNSLLGEKKEARPFSRVWLRWFDSLRRRNGELIDVDLLPFVDNVVPHNLKRTYQNWFVMSEEDIPCDLLVQRQTAITLVDNTYLNINPDTVVHDLGSDYDGIAFEFLTPVDGEYRILGSVALQNMGATGGITSGCAIFKNGALLHDGPFRMGPDATGHSTWAMMELPGTHLVKNDAIQCRGWHDDAPGSPVSLFVNAQGSSRLEVKLQKDPITENQVDNTSKETQILLRTNYAHKATIWVF